MNIPVPVVEKNKRVQNDLKKTANKPRDKTMIAMKQDPQSIIVAISY